MIRASQTTVPWLPSAVPFTTATWAKPTDPAERARSVVDGQNHNRYRRVEAARRRRWRGPDGMVHETEAMANPHWGVDRLSACRRFCLNEHPQASHANLDIETTLDPVTCIECFVTVTNSPQLEESP